MPPLYPHQSRPGRGRAIRLFALRDERGWLLRALRCQVGIKRRAAAAVAPTHCRKRSRRQTLLPKTMRWVQALDRDICGVGRMWGGVEEGRGECLGGLQSCEFGKFVAFFVKSGRSGRRGVGNGKKNSNDLRDRWRCRRCCGSERLTPVNIE
jgi:hypothetical protein